MMKKRGQAAMEFLMTYGWALLVVLVAIGALAFFGVLNPGQFLPSSCNLFPGLGCGDFRVNTTHVVIVFQNGLGEDLKVSGIGLTGDGGVCTSTAAFGNIVVAGTACTAFPCTVGDGKSATVTMTCGGTAPTAGSKYKSDITISYALGTSTLTHSKTGQLVSPVE